MVRQGIECVKLATGMASPSPAVSSMSDGTADGGATRREAAHAATDAGAHAGTIGFTRCGSSIAGYDASAGPVGNIIVFKSQRLAGRGITEALLPIRLQDTMISHHLP